MADDLSKKGPPDRSRTTSPNHTKSSIGRTNLMCPKSAFRKRSEKWGIPQTQLRRSCKRILRPIDGLVYTQTV